jgi:RNA polymerase sigma-70 factor (ECF subfamily)
MPSTETEPGGPETKTTIWMASVDTEVLEGLIRTTQAEADKLLQADAFGEVVKLTYSHVHTLARTLTGNTTDAEEVAQETYARAWRGLAKFRGDSLFSTWLYRITRNTASTYLERRTRHQKREVAFLEWNDDDHIYTDHNGLDGLADKVDVEQEVEDNEFQERVIHSLGHLSLKYRQAVALRDIYGLSHEEIAEKLGISVSTSKVRVHRGHKKLKDLVFDNED